LEGIIMASVAQIQANRLNAQKSTGPRTTAGKERASQNAIRHGLLARDAVIQGEDPEEFEIYREGMLQDLAPAGAVETMLAERVVGLSWRLRRAERLQNAAFAALDEGEPTPLLEARHEEWRQIKGSEWDHGLAGLFDEDAGVGKVVVADFAEARVLDRLLMYERRIESSLYRTMAELRREREARAAGTAGEASCLDDTMTLLTGLTAAAAAATEEVPRSEGGLAAGREPATAGKLGSFGADGVEEGANAKREAPSVEDVSSAKITPYGVTTNAVAGSHGRDARATGTLGDFGADDAGRATGAPAETLHDRSCETNPIAGREAAGPQEYGRTG
jgi:hypothetical protein